MAKTSRTISNAPADWALAYTPWRYHKNMQHGPASNGSLLYVECTFSNISQPLVVLLGTDETDTDYLKGIQRIFYNRNNTQLILMREGVQDCIRQMLPNKFDNNFLIYKIEKEIAQRANAFSLEHRKNYDCRDCFNLKQHLLRLPSFNS